MGGNFQAFQARHTQFRAKQLQMSPYQGMLPGADHETDLQAHV
jgi:hypothetical protein